MIPLPLATVAAAVRGELVDAGAADVVVTGNVEFDSRKIGRGDLFIAIPGARVDGHDFLEAVAHQGAAAALVSRPIAQAPLPTIVVPPHEMDTHSYAAAHDTDGSVGAMLHALGNLARYVVTQLQQDGLQVIGLTGSAGKTSTKDMLATICGAAGPTVAPAGSFNNEIGHPYTALQCTGETRYLVSELSARGIGDVAHLARLAPPQVGVELNVGTAHLGEFGSQAAIAQAKGELIEALPASGVAVLNADDALVWSMHERSLAPIWAYTMHPEVPEQIRQQAAVVLRAQDIRYDAQARASFTAVLETTADARADACADACADSGALAPQQAAVQLQVVGEHQVANALAAMLGALAAGVDFATIVTAINTHTTRSAHRMEVTQRGGITIIDDAYNANPESMRAGLEAAQRCVGDAGRLLVALGPMNEVGTDPEAAEEAHAAIGRRLAEYGIAHAVLVATEAGGQGYRSGAQECGVATTEVADAAAAQAVLTELLQPGDVVYLKASNSYQLWKAIPQLPE